MIKRFAIVLAAALGLAGCGEPEAARIVVRGEISEDQAAVVGEAIAAFERACPDLVERYWGDVESAEAVVWGPEVVKDLLEIDYRWEQWGWTRWIEINVKIVDDPKIIPGRHRAQGHTLYYFLGGGRRPGVDGKKTQSQVLCPMPDGQGSDVLKPAPGLAVVDQLG